MSALLGITGVSGMILETSTPWSWGDTVTWTTKLGTRTYEVVSVQKVLETDNSGTASTTDNRMTLYTCVRDQREYRWQVQAVEVK